jgi:RNA-binding protein
MLSQTQKIQLRRRGHHLHPLIIIGQHGLTPPVHVAIDEALNAHELIKIRVNADDKPQRLDFIQQIIDYHQADMVQAVGHLVLIYRKKQSEAE